MILQTSNLENTTSKKIKDFYSIVRLRIEAKPLVLYSKILTKEAAMNSQP